MRTIGQVGVARSRSADGNCTANVLVLSLLLCLAGLSVACGILSQAASNPSTGTPASQSTPLGQLRVSTSPGPATVGVAYNAVTSVGGGAAPYNFAISSGSLPAGLLLNSRTGSITGTPSVAGTYNFLIVVSTLPGRVSGTGQESGSNLARIVVSPSTSSASAPAISISPGTATVPSQGQQQFSAKISGSANTAVTWSASPGTISSSGVFTAPKVTSNTSVIITATTAAEPSLHAAATVTVSPLASLAIATTALADAYADALYNATLSASGGVIPYQWSIARGTLPSGIQLQASSGIITGTTAFIGSYPFTARVADSSGHSATLALTFTVSPSSVNGFDGPAELPRIYIQTAMSNSPAPGNTITVNSGGDLQSTLNSANCGDTIQLQAGATFTGVFTFPAKSCDDNHWIIVRTGADDSTLPAEGTRLTPCYAGVSSLPGRPSFQCASTNNVLAKLVMAGNGNGPIQFAPGANHYRLIGLEVTRAAGTGIVYALSSLAAGGTANNLILDRVWLHGTARDDTNKGVELGGSSYVSVIDSFFTDFHCISITGSCIDAIAVGGGAGNPVGPFKITDNFLEASGENVIFGGAQSTITPADIEISRNHFFKPMTWMQVQPGYVGGTNGNPFVVKNLFELKNAQRVLMEANILEDSWGGFSQHGFAILLTPKNQAASNGPGNLCPICQVTDVTIRYNTLSHLGAGMQIANGWSDNGGAPLNGERYSIHDITIDDIDPVKYDGGGRVAEIGTIPAPLLQNVSINHVTAFAPTGLFSVGGETNPKMANVTITNSILSAGSYPIWSTGGGPTNCAYFDKPLTTFDACFGSQSFANNAVIGSPSAFPPSLWPSGNFFPATASAVQLVNFNNGNGGNYQLMNTSPYRNAGTDGKDLGADVTTILSETAGAY
ncbi:MAG: Ig domain-containing protein [Candidatus Sulfotelmatobacter sp.]